RTPTKSVRNRANKPVRYLGVNAGRGLPKARRDRRQLICSPKQKGFSTCPSYGFTTSAFLLTVTAPGRSRITKILWASAVRNCPTVRGYPNVSEDYGQRGWHDGHRRRFRRARLQEYRRVYPGPQHVRTRAWTLA